MHHKNSLQDHPKPSLIALAVLPLLGGTQAQAQSEPAAPTDSVVVVTGFRARLNSALNVKKDSDGIVDVIKAEDIAKFPDANLAESLQRVPGVALGRGDGGEGSKSPYAAWTVVAFSHVHAADLLVWPEGVPNAADIGPERVEQGRTLNVSQPSLTYFPASPDRASGTALIVAPGGSYQRLATVREGEQHARWLNHLGVNVFLLKYRLAQSGHPAPLQDVLRAVRTVRSRAKEYGIDPDKIGVMGSSAGGHVAASALTLCDHDHGKTGAALDAVSARPDFGILLYPVITMAGAASHKVSRESLLGPSPSPDLAKLMSLERQVTPRTPPVLLIHTQEDASVPVENSLLFYQALNANLVPAEMILYERDTHGMGIRPGLGATSSWPDRVGDWLRARRLIKP